MGRVLQQYRHVWAWGLRGRQDPPVLYSRVLSGAVEKHWVLQPPSAAAMLLMSRSLADWGIAWHCTYHADMRRV